MHVMWSQWKPFFMSRGSSLSAVSDNSRITADVEYYGFIVDVVKHLAREIPFQFEWVVDTRPTRRQRTAHTAPVRTVLTEVRAALLALETFQLIIITIIRCLYFS